MVTPFAHAIALTGGIATGKSTVCNLLKLYGFHIIDADAVAHELLDENSDNIAKLFGNQYVKDGKVLRKELGKLIFGNKEERLKLEKLLHPQIKKRIEKLAQKEEKFKVPYFIDIPLFFEKRNYPIKKVVVVYAPKELQVERLCKRERLSLEEARQRIKLQIDIEEKRKMADYIIDNSQDLKHLQKEVERFIEQIKVEYAIG
ncbi:MULTISPECIES: dephospho-CoA kinase [Nitratiruptor]|uniref:Dephospho-CoA kinase n=1 Tax=Nitratiruptor tergarcus DSM 16512 TaxID=1069081 RepID=A0A1W1WSQ8_9BACT|nr:MULTISPECIES: dephospho-CoA kinase [Nitratiruptor]BCD61243.1 dephospho-CoA kinase [Nitratiruptor sp. YY08-13]BCD65176.1 dephospho-CoA kinase [Nitratiruptor sp. YY08-26]SMC08753.1 dephospho-CoA kinase [Nitratiruptor tergarcus DSM 16512]